MWWIELELVKGIKFSINYFHIPSKVMHIQILVVIEYIGKVIPRLGNTKLTKISRFTQKIILDGVLNDVINRMSQMWYSEWHQESGEL